MRAWGRLGHRVVELVAATFGQNQEALDDLSVFVRRPTDENRRALVPHLRKDDVVDDSVVRAEALSV